jgi:NAD(P)-dependent dehydrogenase (short-subunit alcohol dehydrogenase family)
MNVFDIQDKVIVLTGGGGVLGKSMARHLLENQATVILLSRRESTVKQALAELNDHAHRVEGFTCDVMDKAALESVAGKIMEKYGRIDVLINAAGGNMPGATIGPDQTIFDLNTDDFRKIVDLNLLESVLPSLVFGQKMVENNKGSIINLSSMTAQRAITRVVGYSASKAAIDNYTKWLAVELALKFGDGLRVNAVAPGFFIGNQNRALLTNPDGSFTERGNTIIQNTPMKRFGNAEELNGVIQFLCSDASGFITGIVIPVDGGFSAFSGV